MIKKTAFIIGMLLLLPDVQAQNSTSSPLSIFGIGEIELRDFGRTTGMGSVGIGLQSENYLNNRNPAGIAGIDTLRFILDVSAAMKFSEFSTAANKGRANDFNFKSLAIGVRLSKRWTSSAGLSPYSNTGYRLRLQRQTPGTTDIENLVYTGSGGINKFYWANAYELFRGFSLGVTSSFKFGNITHIAEEDIISIRDTYNAGKLYFDFGVQYSHWFERHTNIIVGGVYGYKSQMSIEHTRMVTSYNMVERNQRLPDMKIYIPESYGAGFSILRNKKAAEWIFAADYTYRNWSTNRLRHKTLTYDDNRTYSAGLQFTPNKSRPENYLQFMRFMLGACYNESYLKVNGFQQTDYSLSFGVGLPFYNQQRQTLSYVNVSVNIGESATGERGGITERYMLFSVNMSLIERWFAKYRWN